MEGQGTNNLIDAETGPSSLHPPAFTQVGVVQGVARLRRPAVAGYFYPADAAELGRAVDQLLSVPSARQQALGALVPHAALRFSGLIAGRTLGPIEIPEVCVILGAGHTGQAPAWSLMADATYQTPLGEVPVAEELAAQLLEACPRISADAAAHYGEHSIEVPLVFLQRCGPRELAIVPIVVGASEADECVEVGGALADVVSRYQRRVLIVASSDLTHYEPRETAVQHDARLIGALTALDGPGLLAEVRRRGASVCGDGAMACALAALGRLGATAGRLARSGTSADAGGDPHSVVGYAGVVFR
ncbi:MAG: AmmeMemoRadiSam system protein B [Candidatus Omnitrophica bacterium]|nr:AmmeMemoRadiSam system protein B [Candidatus Omnitrophota bacterium]